MRRWSLGGRNREGPRGPEVHIVSWVSLLVLGSQHMCNRITVESQVTHSNTRKDRPIQHTFQLPGLYCPPAMKPLNPVTWQLAKQSTWEGKAFGSHWPELSSPCWLHFPSFTTERGTWHQQKYIKVADKNYVTAPGGQWRELESQWLGKHRGGRCECPRCPTQGPAMTLQKATGVNKMHWRKRFWLFSIYKIIHKMSIYM